MSRLAATFLSNFSVSLGISIETGSASRGRSLSSNSRFLFFFTFLHITSGRSTSATTRCQVAGE